MLSFLQKPSNGTDQPSLRDAYRQRLQEIGESTPVPSAISDGTPDAEAGQPGTQFFSRISKAKAEEKHPVPAVAATCEVPKESPSGAGPVAVASVRPVAGFNEFSTKIAQSLTECWSGAFMGLERQVSLDRDRLQTALANLDSLAGNVQSVAGCLDPLSERTDVLDRNYHELGPRLIDAEKRLAASQRGIECLNEELGQIRELCQGVQERIGTQGETIAALEQTVRNQADLIGTQVKAALSQVGERFEAFTQALDAHTEAIGKLDASSSRADAAAQSLEHRLDRQAQAIQSVHGAAQAQADRWAQLREVTVGFANLLQSPVGNPPAAQEL
jgi:uncharacterized coiled-coil protein SlyX